MNILAPSILSADFGHLTDQIKETEKGGALWSHIDVMDGHFVPQISFGIPVIKSIRPQLPGLFFDAHLMVFEPETMIADVADAGADLITFHLEATEHPEKCIELIRNAGKKVGISIKPKTPVETVLPYLDQVDLLLIMTVEPGFGGQKYIEASNDRIREVRSYIDRNSLSVLVEIDGGVTLDNVEVPLEAGAEVIVSGSAVYKGDICRNTADFNAVLAKYS
ncbi:MAG: ribulose-phosphate 3-epimerase [Lachnospiraceae bacterium]|nr:ribulose-phosphate 3-epimerase [Lachnospiraceae bacterium]